MDPTIALAAVPLLIILHSVVVFRGEPYEKRGCRKRSKPVKPPLACRDLMFSLAFPGALSERSDLRWFLKIPAMTAFCTTVYLGLFTLPIAAFVEELAPLAVLVPALWLGTGLLDFIVTSPGRLGRQSSYKCWKKKLTKTDSIKTESISTSLATHVSHEMRLEDPELWLSSLARSASKASTPRFEHKYRQAALKLAGANNSVEPATDEIPVDQKATTVLARLIKRRPALRRPAW
ncbi:MAG: hypothetical protein KC777_17675 [Cyanobacteria bacterium HKST-UBA02]|nr:hypothetical protein [Cyanobacteria bacterium HKST-UBA02]